MILNIQIIHESCLKIYITVTASEAEGPQKWKEFVSSVICLKSSCPLVSFPVVSQLLLGFRRESVFFIFFKYERQSGES